MGYRGQRSILLDHGRRGPNVRMAMLVLGEDFQHGQSRKMMTMDSSNSCSQTQAPTITLHADHFQPFQSRVGLDTVVRLRFEYDAALVARLKALLTVYAAGTEHKIVGGWLPKHRCWFIEASAWKIVRMELLYLGHRVLERKP